MSPFTIYLIHPTTIKDSTSEPSYKVDNLQSQTGRVGPSHHSSLLSFLGILPLFTLRQFNIFLMLLGIWVCLFLIKVTFGTSRLLLLFYSQILKNHNKKIPTIFIYRANRTEFLQMGAAKPHILLCAPDWTVDESFCLGISQWKPASTLINKKTEDGKEFSNGVPSQIR